MRKRESWDMCRRTMASAGGPAVSGRLVLWRQSRDWPKRAVDRAAWVTAGRARCGSRRWDLYFFGQWCDWLRECGSGRRASLALGKLGVGAVGCRTCAFFRSVERLAGGVWVWRDLALRPRWVNTGVRREAPSGRGSRAGGPSGPGKNVNKLDSLSVVIRHRPIFYIGEAPSFGS